MLPTSRQLNSTQKKRDRIQQQQQQHPQQQPEHQG